MRGFPLLRLALVAGVLGLLAIPVWSLTRPGSDSPGPSLAPALAPPAKAVYSVSLTASSPASLRVTVPGQPAAASPAGASFFETGFEMDAGRPEDLAVSAEFADHSRLHAVRVEVRSGDSLLADTTFWSSRLVEDVVEIPAR